MKHTIFPEQNKPLPCFALAGSSFFSSIFSLLLSVTFLGREPESERMAWLTLFGSFFRAWSEQHAFIFWGIVANFMLMLPLGILLGFGRRGLSFWKTVLCAAAVSVCIECVQYLTRLGYFDVDDILTNVWGAAAGSGFCTCIRKLLAEARRGGPPKMGGDIRASASLCRLPAFFRTFSPPHAPGGLKGFFFIFLLIQRRPATPAQLRRCFRPPAQSWKQTFPWKRGNRLPRAPSAVLPVQCRF